MICSPAGAHRWSLFILVSGLSWLLAIVPAPLARGQTAPAAVPAAAAVPPAPTTIIPSLGNVPNAVKTATDVTPHKAAIQQFLTLAVGQLASESPEAQAKARQALEAEAKVNGQPTASAAYLDVYTQILDTLLQQLITNPSPRVRLNAAIAAANVSQVADNDHLKNIALALVNDQNEAVVLWAIKAAKFIIPAQVRALAAPDLRLIQAIVPAVKAHSKGIIGGAIAAEAYDALTLDVSSNPANLQKFNAKQISAVVPFVLDLLKMRIDMYRRGVPPGARSDWVAARFLCDPKVWPVLTPQQRLDVMQQLVNLIGLAGQQAAAANAGDRIDLATTIKRTAQSMSTVSPNARAGLEGAANLARDASAAQIKAAADSVLPAIKQDQQFQNLQSAPPVEANEPAPAPASAPTTGPVTIPGGTVPTPPPAPTPAPTTPGAPGTARPGPTGGGTTPAPRNGPTPPAGGARPPPAPTPPAPPPGRGR